MKQLSLWASLLFICTCKLFFFPDTTGIETSPGTRGQVLAVNGEIYINFDFSVDRFSVEKIFSIESLSGRAGGSMTWEGDTMIFRPEPELIFGRRYILSCRGTVKDKEGNSYKLDIEVPFFYGSKDELPPEVVVVNPANGQKVTGLSPLVIIFSRQINTLTFKEGFDISPDTDYQADWNVDNTTVTITPEEMWDNLVLYRVSLDTAIRDTKGIPLLSEFETSFLVEDDNDLPSVVNSGPAQNNWGPPPFVLLSNDLNELTYRDAIRITFSEPMDPEKTVAAFSITPAVTGETLMPDQETLVFIPESGYDMSTEYTLAVEKSAEDLYGNTIAADYIVCFSTALNIPVLEVSSIQAIKDTTITMIPSYDTANPQDLDDGGGLSDYNYEFVFSFSEAFAATDEKYLVQSNINISVEFGDVGSPHAVGFTWLTDTTLSVTFTGFNSAAGLEYYYLLEVKGGEKGIKTVSGSYLPESVRQLLRTAE